MSPSPLAAGRSLPGPGQPLRGDRIHRYVTAFCPRCHETNPPLAQVRRLSGVLLIRDDRVWLERGCPDHGLVRTLYDESPEILRYLEKWQAPTKQHIPDQAGNFRPIPEAYAYGLPAMQTQHTCILLQDIIEHCNLRCPTCFTASGPQLQGVAPLSEVLANIDTRLARENGRLDVLMLSGGEPTLYPHLAELLDELVARPIVRIMVNSNGMLMATDDELLALLARHRDRVEVYLQYDGPSKEASIHHRGGDLTRFKDMAIERLSEAGVFTTLTMTATLGVNDGEVGAVVMRALETPFVGGVALQPVFGSGRGHGIDPMDRLTHTGVLERLAEQTNGVVSWHDLTALPCSHPHCASVGYMLKDDSGVWRSLTALIGHDQLLAWLELNPDSIANRIADSAIPLELRTLMKSSLLDLLSEQSSLSHPKTVDLWKNICTQCDLGIGTLTTLAAGKLPGQQQRLRRLLGERITRIMVKPFMDISTMIEERLTQCCVHVGTKSDAGDHQCAPSAPSRPGRPVQATDEHCYRPAAAAGAPTLRMMMSSDSDAKRIASGPLPSQLVRAHATRHGTHSVQPDAGSDPRAGAPFDPLRLCIFATIALLGWLAGPAALALFAAIGFVGYWKARRKGLTKSNCYLRDTRLVLAYLGLLLGAGLWGMYALVARLAGF